MELTQKRVAELFYLDGSDLKNRIDRAKRKAKKDEIAGSLSSEGYRAVWIDGNRYQAHRVVFFLVHGYMPSQVDHIDCNPMNNSIDNLRAADSSGNNRNKKKSSKNSSGFKGVTWNKHNKRWAAKIGVDGATINLGMFTTPEAAHEAYKSASSLHHGNFGRTE